MSAEITIWLAAVSASAALAWNLGYDRGRARGAAEGWVDHYMKCCARERARRKRNGQFKPKTDLSA